MSRMQRFKDGLAEKVALHKSQIEASQKAGKIPADYSLGWLNSMIWADHHINMRSGEPKFYNRETTVGSIPYPVALKTLEEQQAELKHPDTKKFEAEVTFLRDACMTQALGLLQQVTFKGREIEFKDSFPVALIALRKAHQELESLLNPEEGAVEIQRKPPTHESGNAVPNPV